MGVVTITSNKTKVMLSILLIIFVFMMITNVSANSTNDTVQKNIVEQKDNMQDTVNIDESGSVKDNAEITKKTVNDTVKEDASTKVDPEIRLSGSEIHPGVKKTFLALLPQDSKGTVTFRISKTNISPKIKVEDGQASYTYTIPKTFNSQKYYLYAIYSGDSKYNAKRVNATLILTPEGGKVNASMILKNHTTKYNTAKKLTVKLNKDATGTVVFKVDNRNISKAVKIKNGTASYTYTTGLTPGNHTLTAVYSGNFKYEPTNVSSNLTINKLKSKLNVTKVTAKAGNITLFTATATDELGRKIKNMKVQFRLNGKFIGSNKTNSKGIAKLYYKIPSSLYTKTNNITVNTITTKTIMNSTRKTTLTLKQLKTKVMVPNISTKPSKTIVITATVVDEFNNYVTKGTVTFKKGNKTLKTVKVSNGFAKYTYKSNYQTSNKTYIYAIYKGDWKYASKTGRGTYKVTKLKTTISPNFVDAKPNSVVTLTAIVRDQNQNHATDGTVRFSIGSKVIGKAKVKDGVATLKYTLRSYKAKDYRIKAEYLGTKVYKSSSSLNRLTVSRYDTTIKGGQVNAVAGEKTTITVSVTDDENYKVNKGQIKYYINNEYIGTAGVSKGTSSITYVPPSAYDGKTVTYYANYVKNDFYESTSYSNTMIVAHQKTVYVSPNGSDTNLGDQAHPFKTLQHAVSHITLFGTIKLSSGTFYASGIKLDESISIVGSGRDKTFIDGSSSGSSIFNISKRNVLLTIDGITIQNGKSNTKFSAGAIVTSGKLNINNSRFRNNIGSGAYSGGAIYTNGILTVTNTEFVNNVVSNVNSQGGAIRSYSNTTYITDCRFDSNRVTGSNSTGGSVIYADSSDVIINGTTFTKNTATGKYVTGGVIRSIYGAVVIDKSTFTVNTVTSTDTAVGAVVGALSSGVSIQNSAFTSNSIEAVNSAGGSIVYVETAALEMSNSKINSNKVSGKYVYGGAIYSYKAVTDINNSEFNANTINASANGYGGALYSLSGNVTVTRSKFNNNTIKSKDIALAGAIYTYSTTTISNSSFENNNINATSLGGGAIANMGDLTVTQTNFIDNYAYNAGNAITTTTTAINSINNNYWGSSSPTWSNLLYSLAAPTSYSKTKFNM